MRFLMRAMIATMMFIPVASLAQDYDAGLRAAEAGDFATALKEWRTLAEAGDAEAQHSIGYMYVNGFGVPQDYAEALKWFRLAADQGVSRSQFNLGAMYTDGLGVPKNDAEALKWFRLAALQGDVTAQYNIALSYMNNAATLHHTNGKGAPQEFIRAYVWDYIAAANGNKEAGRWGNMFAELMAPEDIVEAERRAKACMASKYQDCD